MPKNKPPLKYGTAVITCPLVKNSIFVQVLYWENSKCVEGVDVSLSPTGASGKTNPQGTKQFKGLADGSYDVSINIGGLARTYSIDKSDEQEAVAGGEEGYCVFFLYQRCSIRVIVAGADAGNPLLAGIGVTISSSAESHNADTVAGSGAADFPNIKPGRYTVSLNLPEALNQYYVPQPQKADPGPIEVDGGGHAEQRIVLPLRPAPTLRVADPQIILVKRDYQDGVTYRPHRLAIYPGKTQGFDGEGLIEANLANSLWLYRAAQGGEGKPLPAEITNEELVSGGPLYLEARQPSAVGGPSVLKLSLVKGTIPVLPAVTAPVTCVRVQLDLHGYKATPGGADAPALSDADKIAVGHNLHLQDNRNNAGRALMVMRQAEPSDFAGDLVLSAITAGVKAYPNETVTVGEAADVARLRTANTAIGAAGIRYWVEGAAVSAAVRDSGFALSLAAVALEGDRIQITVVKVTLDVCDPLIPPAVDPVPIPGAKKMGPGRFLHLQDAGNHHTRAKVLISAVQPAGFAGNLEVVVWDVTANSSANPRLSLYTAANPGGAAAAQPCVIAAATAPAVRWAEGSVVSPAALDTELRLRVAGAEGWADRASLTVGKFFVTQITFRNTARDIYYARIPDAGDLPVAPSYLLAAVADRNVPHKHFTPAEQRPAAASPHWLKHAGDTIAPDLSWPAVYTRTGAAGAPPAPQLRASFEIVPHIPGNIDTRISATSTAGPGVAVLAVTLQNGVAADQDFTINALPGAVARLDGMELKWNYLEPAHVTKHTLFVVDETPKPANNGYADIYLWEIFEWSCHWANGVTGHQNVLNAVWGHFSPAQAPPVHDTGLTYWKNQPIVQPNQNIEDAIRSKDGAANVSGAASCIVFDRILINCVTVQGIHAAEVKVIPDNMATAYANHIGTIPSGLAPPNPATYNVFTDSLGRTVYMTGWVDTTTTGQANIAAPPRWESHWIAAINTPGGWQFYDSSYGVPPVACVGAPGAAPSIFDILPYEPSTAQTFVGVRITIGGGGAITIVGNVADIPTTAVAGDQPHLLGIVLWRS